jgi:DNA gyrase inhibitor GyrI
LLDYLNVEELQSQEQIVINGEIPGGKYNLEENSEDEF